MAVSAVAIRSSVGVELWSTAGPRLPYEHKPELPREETKNSRSITFSPNGRYFAYTNGQEIKVLQAEQNWGLQCSLPRPKAFYLKFSPRGNYLCTWEMYMITKDTPEGSPNMFVYELHSGAEVFGVVQKSHVDWEPSWSMDESTFAIVVGGEALFYDLGEGVEGFKAMSRKVGGLRGGILSLGPGTSPPFLAFYMPGSKGAPSMCKLYKYPAIAQNQTVACKSFFQADRIEMLWNRRGTGLLLLTSTEVDKSGASYYGNQALHFMATKGESCSVPLSKDGPVHCVKWSPKATEFVVVYGFMPSKAALYNLKCDVVFDFGEGPRNCAYFNPFGSLVVLAGFGNLPGNVEIWDVNKKEKLADMKCPDTTFFEWNPNGEHFITATTAPRLRIGNGFKVYHYSGALLHETLWPQNQELLGLEWQQFPDNTFDEPPITKVKHEGIKSSQPEASKNAYTPPHLRLKNLEKCIPGLITGQCKNRNITPRSNGQKSNTTSKHNKRREYVNNEADQGQNDNSEDAAQFEDSTGEKLIPLQRRPPNRKQAQQRKHHQQLSAINGKDDRATNDGGVMIDAQQLEQPVIQQQQPPSTTKKVINPEKEKKIRAVSKKLSDIKKLKVRQIQGETLELNQLNKISMEAKFLEELKALKLTG